MTYLNIVNDFEQEVIIDLINPAGKKKTHIYRTKIPNFLILEVDKTIIYVIQMQ